MRTKATRTTTPETRETTETAESPSPTPESLSEAEVAAADAAKDRARESPPLGPEQQPRRRGRPRGSRTQRREAEAEDLKAQEAALQVKAKAFQGTLALADGLFALAGARTRIDPEDTVSLAWAQYAAAVEAKYGEIPYSLEIMFMGLTVVRFGPSFMEALRSVFAKKPSGQAPQNGTAPPPPPSPEPTAQAPVNRIGSGPAS